MSTSLQQEWTQQWEVEVEALWGWEEEEEWVAGLQEEEEDTAGWWNLGNISWSCYQPWVGAEREAGQRVQSNFTVSSVIQTFRLEHGYVNKLFTADSHSGYYSLNSNVYIHCLISVYFMDGCHITVQESCVAWGEEKKPSLGDTVHLPTISLVCLKDSKTAKTRRKGVQCSLRHRKQQ